MEETAIFKRKNKFFTKKLHYIYSSEDGENWTKGYLQNTEGLWNQWSIFLDDVFVLIMIQKTENEYECETNLVLLFFDLKSHVNIVLEPFFMLKLGKTIEQNFPLFSLLATKSNIHIITTNMNKKRTYFNLKF